MQLKTCSHSIQKEKWPRSGQHILAQHSATSIIVYQAFNPEIAREAVLAQSFSGDGLRSSGYSGTRMTWIKPNFLWMMYRSGWASKPGQERILAIRLSRSGFEEILRNASSNDQTLQRGKKENGSADLVRLQWDPDHEPDGSKVETGRRAIQLGLRGEMLTRFSDEFIQGIEDITDDVHRMAAKQSDWSELDMPEESVYKLMDESLAEKIKLDSFPDNES